MFSSAEHIPRIRTYTQAKDHFVNTKPIRGKSTSEWSNAGKTPLGRRRDTAMYNIRELRNGDIACRLYNTDVVTFRPDGDIVLVYKGYVTCLTNGFISQLLGVYAHIKQGLPYLDCVGATYPLDFSNPNVLRVSPDDGHIRPTKTFKRYKHIINRKAANKLYIKFRHLLTHAESLFKVADAKTMPHIHGRDIKSMVKEVINTYILQPDSLFENIDAIPTLIAIAVKEERVYSPRYNVQYSFDAVKMKRCLYDCIKKEYAHEVFTKVEVTDGKYYDGNVKYFT